MAWQRWRLIVACGFVVLGWGPSALAQTKDLAPVVAAFEQLNLRLRKNAWELVYEHQLIPEDGEPRGYTQTTVRDDNSLVLTNAFPDGSTQIRCWDSGVCVAKDGGVVSVSTYYDPALVQLTRYTNGLFWDISPADAMWAPEIAQQIKSKGPSAMFVWALPRSISRRLDEFTQNEAGEFVRGSWDRISFHPDKGYVCGYRRYNFKDEFPLFEVTNKDFVEAEPGVWLPRTQEWTRYSAPPNAPATYGQRIAREINTLKSFKFINTGGTEFEVPLDDVAAVYDRIQRTTFRRFPKGTSAEAALARSAEEARSRNGSMKQFNLRRAQMMWLTATIASAWFLSTRMKRA